MTPAGIELATFRFVAQHLNYCARLINTSLRVTKKCSAYGLRSGGFAVRIQAVQDVSLLSKECRPSLGPTQHGIQRVLEAFSVKSYATGD